MDDIDRHYHTGRHLFICSASSTNGRISLTTFPISATYSGAEKFLFTFV